MWPTCRQAAGYLVGRHDFRSFEAAGAPRKTSVRTVSELTVERQQRETHCRIVVEIEADGFLYNMVRNIVGSLVLVGRGERPADWIQDGAGRPGSHACRAHSSRLRPDAVGSAVRAVEAR